MAAPSYTEDLSDITLAESTTGWAALGGGGAGLSASPDLSMQGTNCVDKQVTGAEKGQYLDFGSTITPGANTHFFVWCFVGTPGLTDSLANRGLAIVIGTSGSAFNKFHVEGNDTYGAAGRVGKCYPIRYVTTSNGSPPYRTLTGSPGANPQVFGATINITASVKGANLGVDAIRYGTGGFVTSGESGDPGNFAGFAAQNDSSTNRWGILTRVGGVYELQGRFVVGQDNAGTPTAAYFAASNATVAVVDTVHSLTDFSQIIVDHASTTFNLTNVTIVALGTNNPGRLVFNNASTTAALTGCSFQGIGITTLRAGVTVSGCTWRASGQITQNGATIDGSIIAASPAAAALVADDISLVTNCEFVSAGSGYAIEGFSSAGSYDLAELSFSGYAASDGSTGNEAIHVLASTGTVTLNISGGTIPTVHSAGATIVKSSNPVSVSVTVKDTGGSNIQDARVLLLAGAGGPFPSDVTVTTITRSGSTATVEHSGHGLADNDKVQIKGADQPEYNGVWQINVTDSDHYEYTVSGSPASPATGTIKATFAVLSALSSGAGLVSMSRVFASDQPVTGRVRKSSGSPYYQTANLIGTVDSGSGLAITAQLIADE